MGTRKFPNLFIIGAMKAGTSSLHEYLHQHPEIFMSRFKEPQYFAPHQTPTGHWWGQGHPFPEPGIDWYLRLFQDAGDVKYAGESSVSYTAAPWVIDCDKRIHEFNPEARLIYIMRDPVERSISHYWHFVVDGRETRPMLEAMRKKEEYVSRSHYARQIWPYIETFGRDRLFLLTLEELTAEPKEVFRRLFHWLGVDPDVAINSDEVFNVTAKDVKHTRRGLVWLDRFIKGWRWPGLHARTPRWLLSRLDRLAHRSIHRSEVDPEPATAYLRPILQDATRELEDIMGRKFPEWTTLYASRVQSNKNRPVAAKSVVVPQ
jgi:hypothetical protein